MTSGSCATSSLPPSAWHNRRCPRPSARSNATSVSELFRRVDRKLVLADAGAALIAPARQVVRSLVTARDSVAEAVGLRTGRVEIAAMPSQSVGPAQRYVGSGCWSARTQC